MQNNEIDKNLLNIMKSYVDTNIDNNFLEDKEDNANYNEYENIYSQYTVLFSNSLIQTSFSKFTILKRIIIRKENLTMIHFFDKWRNNKSDCLAKNRKVIEDIFRDKEEIEPNNHLNESEFFENELEKWDMPLQSQRVTKVIPKEQNTSNINPNVNLLSFVIKNLFENDC